MIELSRREFFDLPRKLGTGVVAARVTKSLPPAVAGVAWAAAAALAQTDLEYYFPDTEHHLSGDFLNFWRRNWNGHIFGQPITEEVTDQEGWKVQWFENVRMEQDPEDGHVQLGALSNEFFKINGIPIYDMNSKTLTLFGSRFPADLGLSLGEFFPDPVKGTVYHTERMAFAQRGIGITATEKALAIQVKSNAEVVWPGDIEPKHLGTIMAERLEIDTEGIEKRESATTYNPKLFDGFKRIDVDVEEQSLVGFEGDFPVFRVPVSTGARSAETPSGIFRVLTKEDLIPYIGWNGTRYYDLPDVPYNLRFYPETYIHGTYWHDQFGLRQSLGCVNLDPYNAAWLYDWARIGTPVKVHH